MKCPIACSGLQRNLFSIRILCLLMLIVKLQINTCFPAEQRMCWTYAAWRSWVPLRKEDYWHAAGRAIKTLCMSCFFYSCFITPDSANQLVNRALLSLWRCVRAGRTESCAPAPGLDISDDKNVFFCLHAGFHSQSKNVSWLWCRPCNPSTRLKSSPFDDRCYIKPDI